MMAFLVQWIKCCLFCPLNVLTSNSAGSPNCFKKQICEKAVGVLQSACGSQCINTLVLSPIICIGVYIAENVLSKLLKSTNFTISAGEMTSQIMF